MKYNHQVYCYPHLFEVKSKIKIRFVLNPMLSNEFVNPGVV